MPLWDFWCASCQITRERWFVSYAASEEATCETCGARLVRQASHGGFVVRGYNAKNNYSKKS